MSQGKPRSVREALSPRSRVRKRPKPRITLAACPICRQRMSLVVLDTHIDKCKPPRLREPPSPPRQGSQQITQASQGTTQAGLQPVHTQSYFGTPPSDGKNLHDIHFCLRRDEQGNPVCTVQRTTCQTCGEKAQLAFGAVVALRGYVPSSPSPSPSSPHLFLHACASESVTTPLPIPALPSGSPASRLPLSILKSALQKCVRRRLSQPAVRVAVALLRKTRSPFELLRRLSIIVLEDAALHPQFPTLVWLLAASSKGYISSFEDVRMIVTVVHEVAACTVRDVGTAGHADDGAGRPEQRVSEDGGGVGGTGPDANDTSDQGGTGEGAEVEEQKSERWRSVVDSMRIRACYGGMSFDQSLLRRCTAIWELRFSANAGAWEGMLSRTFAGSAQDMISDDGLRILLREDAAVLRPGDIPPAAWDFHCCAVADDVSREILGRGGPVVERFPRGFDDVKNGVESLMWTYRSGVNLKRPWTSLEEAILLEKEGPVAKGAECSPADEILWRTELEPSINAWCRKYRRRYGL